jgi:hypothetical protein
MEIKSEFNYHDYDNIDTLRPEYSSEFGPHYYEVEESIVYLKPPKRYIYPKDYEKPDLDTLWITMIDNVRVHVTPLLEFDKEELKQMYSNFGSFLDYLIIINDDDFNMILMNCNPDSKNYQKVVLKSTDINGHTIYNTSKYTLDEILTKLKEKELNYKQTGDVETDFYNMPIKKLMEDENMKTHFYK